MTDELERDDALLRALIGDTPREDPGPPRNLETDFEERDLSRPQTWPMEGRGPPGGVSWLRFIASLVTAAAGDVERAAQMGRELQHLLASGELQTVAMSPNSGVVHPLGVEPWRGTGEAGRLLRWLGTWGQDDSVPRDVYVINPPQSLTRLAATAAPAGGQSDELTPRERTSAAKLIATLVLKTRRGFRRGLAAELERDTADDGHPLSDDTIRQWLKLAEDVYDPSKDTRRKS